MSDWITTGELANAFVVAHDTSLASSNPEALGRERAIAKGNALNAGVEAVRFRLTAGKPSQTSQEATMSERDELAEIIQKNRWHRNGGESSEHIADSILAAGFRRIPDDCVVVKRDDVEIALGAAGYAPEWMSESHYYEEQLARLLAATRPGTDNE